jgi:hypothetical protein
LAGRRELSRCDRLKSILNTICARRVRRPRPPPPKREQWTPYVPSSDEDEEEEYEEDAYDTRFIDTARWTDPVVPAPPAEIVRHPLEDGLRKHEGNIGFEDAISFVAGVVGGGPGKFTGRSQNSNPASMHASAMNSTRSEVDRKS